jgi:hypothetical protein
LHIRYDKNADIIERDEDSTELCTRIYPFGPDNYTINTEYLQDCDDYTDWTGSGSSTLSDITTTKKEGAGCIKFEHSDGETMTIDLGTTFDLSSIDTITFWIYDATGSGLDFDTNPVTFGMGESAWNDNTFVLTGTVQANSWRKIEIDTSSVADANKNAIRYIGIEGGGENFYVDDIRAPGQIYIDSDNISDYNVNKEYIYFHSLKPVRTEYEVTLYPTDDSYVNSGNPTTNYGSKIVLQVSGTSEMFFKWGDLLEQIPSEATITEATLYLCQYQEITTVSNAPTYRCDSDWSEDTITENTKPGQAGSNIYTWDFTSVGYINDGGAIKTTVQNWHNGSVANHGITIVTASGNSEFYSKDFGGDWVWPKLVVKYSITTDPDPQIKSDAENYLYNNDEPKLRYRVKMADLSRVAINNWEYDTVNLGDTIRVYDTDLDINVDCRVKKITKNYIDPKDTVIDLTNKAYDFALKQVEVEKKLSYAMPFDNDRTIINANAIQEGFLGGDVG